MIDLAGIAPIVATPFTADGALDEASLASLVRHLAAAGCPAVTLFGIAGEYYKLSDAERRRVAEIAIPVAQAHGAMAICSVTDHASVPAVATARLWAELGADALMLLPPFFLKPGAAAVEAHMRTLLAAVELPVVLQYAPEQTGVSIAPAVFAGIASDHPNAAAVKVECKPPGAYIEALRGLCGDRLLIQVGNAGFNMLEGYARGARGAMPGCSLVEIYLAIHAALIAGEHDAALARHTPLLALLNHIRQDVEMIIAFEKHILMRRGLIACDHCRAPAHRPDPIARSMFERLYADLGHLLPQPEPAP